MVLTGLPPAGLAVRAVITGKAKLMGVGPRLTVDIYRGKAGRCRHGRRCHHRIPLAGPATPRGHAAMHAKLHCLDNPHAGRPRPGLDTPVTVIGPTIPGFLMHPYGGHSMAGAQRGQNFDSITNTQNERLAERGQVTVKIAKTFGKEIIMPPGHVGLLPQIGLEDVERDHWSVRRRRGQRGVIVDPQVTLEPDNLHHVPLLYLPSSR